MATKRPSPSPVDTHALQRRIHRLEEQQRLYRLVGIAGICLLVALSLSTIVQSKANTSQILMDVNRRLSQAQVPAQSAQKTVLAQQFVVVDKAGKTRAFLGTKENGDPILSMWQDGGYATNNIAMQVTQEGKPDLTLTEGTHRLTLGGTPGTSETRLSVFDGDKLRAALGLNKENKTTLFFKALTSDAVIWQVP